MNFDGMNDRIQKKRAKKSMMKSIENWKIVSIKAMERIETLISWY